MRLTSLINIACLGLGAALAASPAPAQIHKTLSVVTLNMAKERNAERILQEWRTHPAIWDSDVLLLQEVAHIGDARRSIAETLANEMHRYVVTSAPGVSNKDSDGLAIISRFPLADFEEIQLLHNNMVFHTRNRKMIAATIQSPAGALRVYDIHLDSRVNASVRLKQVEPVITNAAQWDGPCIIGGDFNTNYIRWAGNVLPIAISSQAGVVHEAMAAKGFSTPLVNAGATEHLGMRLDWFYTRDLQVSDTATEPIKFSDHRAVRMTISPDLRVSQAQMPR